MKKKEEELDGCYVTKTDVPKENLTAQTAHDRYKDLFKDRIFIQNNENNIRKD